MNKKMIPAVTLLALLMLNACNFPFAAKNQSETDALATAVAQTVQAMDQQPPPAGQPTLPPQPAQPTNTPLPTLTSGPQATVPPAATAKPCNKAQFISETIPDDTEFAPGEAFTKTWTLKNTGTCTWNTNYKLIFASGDAMGGPASVALASSVAPNEQVTLSVNLTAPTGGGTYTGYWKMQADDNEQYAQVYVRVKTVSAPFAVTGVTYYMPHTTIDMGCPGSVNIKAEITASAAGQVTYYWVDSNGDQSATQSLNYASAGKQIVDYNMTVDPPSGAHWAKVYIDNPNHQMFSQKDFNVNCTP